MNFKYLYMTIYQVYRIKKQTTTFQITGLKIDFSKKKPVYYLKWSCINSSPDQGVVSNTKPYLGRIFASTNITIKKLSEFYSDYTVMSTSEVRFFLLLRALKLEQNSKSYDKKT